MEQLLVMKGEHIFLPEGPGKIIEEINGKVIVQLDSGSLVTIPIVKNYNN